VNKTKQNERNYMTVNEAIKQLQELSDKGFSDYLLKIEGHDTYQLADFCISSNKDESEYFIEVY
jgi:hypothetical protein